MSESLITCILGSLGVAYIITSTYGPFGLCKELRSVWDWAFEGHPDWLRHGIECPICVGFWTTVPIAWYTGAGVCGWLCAIGAISLMIWIKE